MQTAPRKLGGPQARDPSRLDHPDRLTEALKDIRTRGESPAAGRGRWPSREARPFDAASRRRAFCTDGSAALAFASGRARTSTLAGLAAIVISSPVAGLRPGRFLVAGLTRTVS